MKVYQLCFVVVFLYSSCSALKINNTDQAFDYIFPGSQLVSVNTIEQASRSESELYYLLRDNNISEGRLLEVRDDTFGEEASFKVFVGEDEFIFLNTPVGGIKRWLDLENFRELVILSEVEFCNSISGKCQYAILPGQIENMGCIDNCTSTSFVRQQAALFSSAQKIISKLPVD